MATIEARKKPDGTIRYRVKIRLRGFPSQSATFERKTDARQWAQQTEAAMREGRYFKNTAARKHTVSDLIERYLEHQDNRNHKRVGDVAPYLKWWEEEIGMYLVSDLAKTLILSKREKLIPSTATARTCLPIIHWICCRSSKPISPPCGFMGIRMNAMIRWWGARASFPTSTAIPAMAANTNAPGLIKPG